MFLFILLSLHNFIHRSIITFVNWFCSHYYFFYIFTCLLKEYFCILRFSVSSGNQPRGICQYLSVPAKIWAFSFILNCSIDGEKVLNLHDKIQAIKRSMKTIKCMKPQGVIDSQIPTYSKYTTGWNFDPSFTTNNTCTLIKEHKCHLCDRICKTQSGMALHLKAFTRKAA